MLSDVYISLFIYLRSFKFQVVTLRQLRTDYKPYEAKQKLLAAYDVFLTDRKIAECLPRVLGRHFYKKRKLVVFCSMYHFSFNKILCIVFLLIKLF